MGMMENEQLDIHDASAPLLSFMTQVVVSPNGVPFLFGFDANGARLLAEVRTVGGAVNTSALVDVTVPGLDFSQFKSIAFCGDHTLVARKGQSVFGIAGLDSGIEQEETPPYVAWQHTLPFQVAQVIPAVTEIVGVGAHPMIAFSQDLRTMYAFSADADGVPQYRMVPAAMPIDPTRIDVTTILHDENGSLWFSQKGLSYVIELKTGGQFTQFNLPVQGIDGFAIDDLIHLLVVDNGVVRCFSKAGNGYIDVGQYGSMFAGQVVGDGFTVARSTNNFDARYHTGPEWNNVIEPLSCVGDLTSDGFVDGSDLGLVLGAWNTQDGNPADIDGDGIVGGSDLGVLLGAWGSCP